MPAHLLRIAQAVSPSPGGLCAQVPGSCEEGKDHFVRACSMCKLPGLLACCCRRMLISLLETAVQQQVPCSHVHNHGWIYGLVSAAFPIAEGYVRRCLRTSRAPTTPISLVLSGLRYQTTCRAQPPSSYWQRSPSNVRHIVLSDRQVVHLRLI